jgi:hypothetical protein
MSEKYKEFLLQFCCFVQYKIFSFHSPFNIIMIDE